MSKSAQAKNHMEPDSSAAPIRQVTFPALVSVSQCFTPDDCRFFFRVTVGSPFSAFSECAVACPRGVAVAFLPRWPVRFRRGLPIGLLAEIDANDRVEDEPKTRSPRDGSQDRYWPSIVGLSGNRVNRICSWQHGGAKLIFCDFVAVFGAAVFGPMPADNLGAVAVHVGDHGEVSVPVVGERMFGSLENRSCVSLLGSGRSSMAFV